MKRTLRHCTALAALALAAVGPVSIAPTHTHASAIAREPLRIGFGDFTTKAELTYPAGAGRSSALILVPELAPEDMNATLTGQPGRSPLSHNFADIANYLSPRGIAVLRYNQHYVVSPREIDGKDFSTKMDLPQMLRDAEKVLATVKSDPHVDPKRIFVYGWSSGSAVAAALVVRHPELAGLVVQSGATLPWRQMLRDQVTGVGLPYLRHFAPDGHVTSVTLRQAQKGGGGSVAQGIVTYFTAPNAPSGTLVINPALDTNHDGAIDINTEFLPRLDRIIDILLSPAGAFHVFGPKRVLPTLADQAFRLSLPVLILQGDNDSVIPVSGARTLNTALPAKSAHTLRLYPGLGNALGPASSRIDDTLAPIAHAPLSDLAAWLTQHAR